MYSATNSRLMSTLVWFFWFLALLTLAWAYGLPSEGTDLASYRTSVPVHSLPPERAHLLTGIVTHDPQNGSLFPWLPRWRWRKGSLARYRAARAAYRRALWASRMAWLFVTGAMTMAALVDLLTRSQLRRQMGALPVLYALLEVLQVRQIVDRYCPTQGEVNHGTVAVVLVLNRLMAPRPLYRLADWVGQTVLVHTLGIPAAKFNDDRLGRVLDAISAHKREIWLDIVHQALLRFDIDLRFIFYDLTAFVMQGDYAQSELADYGFAHNTPSGKQKIKLGMAAAADGGIPTEYAAWSGRTADLSTVQDNMARLVRLLERRGRPVNETLIIGDRANINDELALAYHDKHLKCLAGLQPQRKEHRELLVDKPEKHFYAHPLTPERGPRGYFGIPCSVTFQYQGRRVDYRGLVVLSGPMRSAIRQGRARSLRELRDNLAAVQAKIGQKRYRSVAEVQARAETQRRQSPVGHLVGVQAYETEGKVALRWWVDRHALWQEMQRDGRYFLVTNDFTLTPERMLALYRAKDGVEKRFEVTKQDLRVRPIYLHGDERIEAMLLINMIALLAYSLLEREVRRKGLIYTARQVREKLEGLAVIETHCWDGSVLYRLTPVSEEQQELLVALERILAELLIPRCHPAIPAGSRLQVKWQLPPGVDPMTWPTLV